MKNEFFVCGDEVFIKLLDAYEQNVMWTIIDLSYLSKIMDVTGAWIAHKYNNSHTYYAITSNGIVIDNKPTRRKLHMHRLILNLESDIKEENEPDHKNRNGLDNRINNLRLVSHSINSLNRKVFSNSQSGITGVAWTPSSRRWRAYISVEGKQIRLGAFIRKKDAIEARRKAEDAYLP